MGFEEGEEGEAVEVSTIGGRLGGGGLMSRIGVCSFLRESFFE